jgi:hypothetical protein
MGPYVVSFLRWVCLCRYQAAAGTSVRPGNCLVIIYISEMGAPRATLPRITARFNYSDLKGWRICLLISRKRKFSSLFQFLVPLLDLLPTAAYYYCMLNNGCYLPKVTRTIFSFSFSRTCDRSLNGCLRHGASGARRGVGVMEAAFL